MKEIKFRAWDSNDRRFVQWDELLDYITTNGSAKGVQALLDRSQQYTGLKDMNGMEIYEGDIDADGYVMTYEWGCFRFRKGRSAKTYTPYRGDPEGQCSRWEVIGNISENPELLEAKQ